MIKKIFDWWCKKPLWIKILSSVFVFIAIFLGYILLFPKKIFIGTDSVVLTELENKYETDYNENKKKSNKIKIEIEQEQEKLNDIENKKEKILDENRKQHEEIDNVENNIDNIIDLLIRQHRRHKKTK
ncbi:MAG: hypothetical protein BV456_09915 [Thermoplasmata archaeon M8B2D]|nr:MAG: hypothetical protein BV456_09915 [Thermoplasmata archaeon M8B2D]